jgi:DNA polymerase (family 10)
MDNKEIARVLDEIADLLEIKGVPYKPIAYRRAAETVNSLSEPVEDLTPKEINKLPGIGESITKKIVELNETGHLPYFEELRKGCPIDFESLLAVEGVGPKTVKLLYQSLNIKDLDDLEEMAKHHQLRRIKGLSEKKEKNILENIKYARKTTRHLLGYMLPLANELKTKLEGSEHVTRVEVAGSIRRRQETIGDIDILVVTDNPCQVMEYFAALDMVDRVIAKGISKSTVRLKADVNCDLRVMPGKSFGSALLYFTGSKEVNVEMRKMSIKRGLKLSEYGLFKGDMMVAGRTEEEIFQELGIHYMEPELRQNVEDVEVAIKGELPQIIGYQDIRGDLHMHTNWSDGKNSLKEMTETARELGHEYIAIADHTGSLQAPEGIDGDKIRSQMNEIDRLDSEFDDITILRGLEVNIDSDGELEVKDKILKDLDVVVAGINSGYRQSREQLTDRIISAMENQYVNIIAHPTGRKIHKRSAYQLDLDRIFQASVDTNTYLEVNSQPDRLDLRDVLIKKAIQTGCKLVIDTDAHSGERLGDMELGIATARRGWAVKKDIINTGSLKNLQRLLGK